MGVTKAFLGKLKLDANYFRRLVNNYADDDQIQNTTISFPIAFRKSIIYGAEVKLDVPDWHRFSGFLSYSYEVGNAWFPVTGGLFLGDDAVLPTSGHFPDSQDQRNTVRGRVRYQVTPRFWIAGGVQFDSGLPFDFDPAMKPASASPESSRSTANRWWIASISIAAASSRVPSECLSGRDDLQVRPVEHADSSGRAEPQQRSQCDRLRRTFLRQRDRAFPELCSALDHAVLAHRRAQNQKLATTRAKRCVR